MCMARTYHTNASYLLVHMLHMPTIVRKRNTLTPASILYKSIALRYRPVSYPDGPITDRYSFIKNASWDVVMCYICVQLLRMRINVRICNTFVRYSYV